MAVIRIVLAFFLCLTSSIVTFAQPIPKLPTDNQSYRFAVLPSDEKPHWQSGYDDFYSWSLQVKLNPVRGLGTGRSAEETARDTSNSLSKLSYIKLTDDAILVVIPTIDQLKSDGKLDRNLLIYLGTYPKEGQSRVGSVIFDSREASTFLLSVGDLLKTGRNWRIEGSPTEDKRIDLDPVTAAIGNKSLGLSIEKSQGVAGISIANEQHWYIYSDRVCFVSSDLMKLSKFYDDIQRALDWLDKFKQTDKISPPE